jgi:hypothetical protein
LYVSTDTGVTFTAKDSERKWRGVAMSASGQYQTATVEKAYDEETESFYGGGMFVSTNYGDTWTLVKDAPEGEGVDWNSCAVSEGGQRQAAAVYGGGVYTTDDYGVTWTNRTTTRNWGAVAMSGDGRQVYARVSGQSIWRSADYGVTWGQVGPALAWRRLVCSRNGVYQLAGIQNGQLWASGPATRVPGVLTADLALGLGTVGQLLMLNGTQLVFVAGTVTNVLDGDVGTP